MGAAVTMTASKGASSGQPKCPSAWRTATSTYPSRSSRARALAARAPKISSVCTSPPTSARTAAWYPEPVPTSSTFIPGDSPSTSVMYATMYGWEMVCPCSMGRG